MQIFLSILLMTALLLIAYYDFRYMEIPVWALILTLLIAFIRLLSANSIQLALTLSGINLLGCLLIITIAFLSLFMLRNKVFNPVNSLLGSGDLVFIPVLCFTMSPLNFIVFFVLSLAVILLFKVFIHRYGRVFPLAGGQSVLLLLVIAATLTGNLNLYDDTFLIQLIY
jgi:Flp pilus assembly protein protease CpaA